MSTIMDPYIILELEPGAESREVIQAAALALRKRHYPGYVVAQAQKELLDPVKRAAQTFLHRLDFEDQSEDFPAPPRGAQEKVQADQKRNLSELKRLTCFDEDPG